jgi:serine/threonine-protein kinase
MQLLNRTGGREGTCRGLRTLVGVWGPDGQSVRRGLLALAALAALLVAGRLEAAGPGAGLLAQMPGPRPAPDTPHMMPLGGDESGAPVEPPPVSEGESTWLTLFLRVIGLIVAFGFVGTVIYLAIKHGQNLGKDLEFEGKVKKKAGGVKVTENQVDNYRLVNLMATGQTSQVYEVAEVSSGRHFALKMLLPEHVKSGEQRRFLFHEAEVGQQIVHPNIVKMLTIKKDPYHPYLVMEFFPSKNLKLRIMHKEEDFIKQHFRGIVEPAATALAFMHEKGWVHRDVKPDNILVNSSAEVRVIDFAIATRKSKKPGLFGSKKKGKPMGTRSYMAPEQIRGEWLDARADIYSFGATMYEALTGRPPLKANNPADLLMKQLKEKPESPQVYNPDIADDLAKLILAMLSKDREGRPRDFHEFLVKFRGMRFLFKSAVVRKKSS